MRKLMLLACLALVGCGAKEEPKVYVYVHGQVVDLCRGLSINYGVARLMDCKSGHRYVTPHWLMEVDDSTNEVSVHLVY